MATLIRTWDRVCGLLWEGTPGWNPIGVSLWVSLWALPMPYLCDSSRGQNRPESFNDPSAQGIEKEHLCHVRKMSSKNTGPNVYAIKSGKHKVPQCVTVLHIIFFFMLSSQESPDRGGKKWVPWFKQFEVLKCSFSLQKTTTFQNGAVLYVHLYWTRLLVIKDCPARRGGLQDATGTAWHRGYPWIIVVASHLYNKRRTKGRKCNAQQSCCTCWLNMTKYD